METKKCTICKEDKTLEEFCRGHRKCRKCIAAARRIKNNKHKECSLCKEIKSICEFYGDPRSGRGLTDKCRATKICNKCKSKIEVPICCICGKRLLKRKSQSWEMYINIRFCSIKCQGKNNEIDLPPLTDQQMEIINGSLLGDGALGDNKGYTYEGQFRNSSFTKGQKAANLEYLDWLNTSLKPYSRNIGHGFSKKNGKLHPRVSLHTSNHKSLTELRKLWYPQGKKIVPKDIILTPLSVAIWFCDDGYNNSDVGYAEIATNGFSFDDTDCLTCALKRDLDVVAYTYKAKRNNKLGVIFYQPIIKIPAKSYLKFIEIISPYIIWNCMAYKIKIEDKIRLFRTNWAEQGQPRMKNGGRNYNSRKKITDADIPYIISLRKQGMYQSEIAKLYGICQGQISKYASNRIAGLQETGVARSAVIVSINEHPEWKPRHIKTELNRQGITVSDSLISLIKKQLKDNTYI